jgi:hypothetical protein
VFVKNTGSAIARNVAYGFLMTKVIPEKKRGKAIVDDLPIGNCDQYSDTSAISKITLAPGQSYTLSLRQGFGVTAVLQNNEPVQLYVADCIYYSDDFEGRHVTCDTYHFMVPSTNPLDLRDGTPTFLCDRTPRMGKFMDALTGHCAN